MIDHIVPGKKKRTGISPSMKPRRQKLRNHVRYSSLPSDLEAQGAGNCNIFSWTYSGISYEQSVKLFSKTIDCLCVVCEVHLYALVFKTYFNKIIRIIFFGEGVYYWQVWRSSRRQTDIHYDHMDMILRVSLTNCTLFKALWLGWPAG